MDLERAAMVAELHYVEGMTQAQIAREIGSSRPTVARLLKCARDQNLIDIHILDRPDHEEYSITLARKLCNLFGLEEKFTRVLYTNSEGEILFQKLGRLGAGVLEELILHVQKCKSEKPHMSQNITLGVSFGVQLRYTVDFAYPKETIKNLMVIPLVGGIATDEENLRNESNELARRIAKHYRGHWRHLLCPARVDSLEAKKVLESQTLIADVIQQASSADIYLLGIGSSNPDREFSSKLQAGLITETLLKKMEKEHNAVGFICAKMYDDKGDYCPYPESFGSIVGISFDDLRGSVGNGGYSLAIAGGERYYSAVHGALSTGCINCLVTDQRCAKWIISKEESRLERNNLKAVS